MDEYINLPAPAEEQTTGQQPQPSFEDNASAGEETLVNHETETAAREARRQKPSPWPWVLLGLAVALFAAYVVWSRQDPTVAVVNGQKITESQWNKALQELAGKNVLNNLIDETLIQQKAKQEGVAVSDEEIKDRINQVISGYPSEEAFVQANNLTKERFRHLVTIDLMASKVIEKSITPVTDQDIQKYYEEHPEEFQHPDQVKARHILVNTKEEADEIYARLAAGGDFAAIAKEKSQDFSSKDQGGELGYFSRGQMVPEFEEAAFSLAVGELSKPVKTDYGWHIIQVEDKKPAKTDKLEEVKEKIRRELIDRQVNDRFPSWMESLRQEAKIDVKVK